MPYPHMLPVIKEPILEGEVSYTIQHPDMLTSWEEMQKSWIQLKEEWNSLETNLHASEKKVLELTRLLHEEKTLNTYISLEARFDHEFSNPFSKLFFQIA